MTGCPAMMRSPSLHRLGCCSVFHLRGSCHNTQRATRVLSPRIATSHRPLSSRLTRIGRLEEPRPTNTPYQSGQYFVHASLGYRGVIVMPWEALVHEYPTVNNNTIPSNNGQMTCDENSVMHSLRPVHASCLMRKTFYQVLADKVDTQEHKRVGIATQTWTPHRGVVQDIDLVGHDDILPYIPLNSQSSKIDPIQHPLFSELFTVTPTQDSTNSCNNSVDWKNVSLDFRNTSLPSGTANSVSPSSRRLQPQNNSSSISSSSNTATSTNIVEFVTEQTSRYKQWFDVMKASFKNKRCYECTSHSIRVTIIPFFDTVHHFDNSEKASAHKAYSWYYKAIVSNIGDIDVQLMSKWWQTVDRTGHREFFRGRGILRQFPVLSVQEPSFQGSFSAVQLNPDGMHRNPISVEVPTFELERDDVPDSSETHIS
eukprot:gene2485-5415_t